MQGSQRTAFHVLGNRNVRSRIPAAARKLSGYVGQAANPGARTTFIGHKSPQSLSAAGLVTTEPHPSEMSPLAGIKKKMKNYATSGRERLIDCNGRAWQ